jgi:hypothetical protein
MYAGGVQTRDSLAHTPPCAMIYMLLAEGVYLLSDYLQLSP